LILSFDYRYLELSRIGILPIGSKDAEALLAATGAETPSIALSKVRSQRLGSDVYVGNVTLGTPAQVLQVVIDTGTRL